MAAENGVEVAGALRESGQCERGEGAEADKEFARKPSDSEDAGEDDSTDDPGEEAARDGKPREKVYMGLPCNIPERIIKKLARIAGLEYKEGHKRRGGGLCLGLESGRQRRKALEIVGALAGRIGADSTERALRESGADWLDVLGWREDAEYAMLWAAAERVRDTVAASRTKDALWERTLNGYEVEEAKTASGEIRKVTVRRVDSMLGVQLLKGLGYIGKDSGVRPSVKVKAPEKPAAVDGVPVADSGPGPAVDTVLFADRRTAFEAMGKAGPAKKAGN